ncbi:MAG TPA: aspartate-semialdehyde dehydrogenase [Planctomycetota bacterium]|nr:aspartate-semialdehyde dehydrogenase [Planctomycetota bacterium]
MTPKVVAVVGATGAVGAEFLKVLEDRNFPIKSLKLLASARSTGKKLKFKGQELPVEELGPNSFKGVEVALFSAGAQRSKDFAPIAVKAGAIVVDNSSAFRMDEGIPLIVPEVNADVIKTHKGIIANPNCSTIQMVVAINPIHKEANIERVVVATYQAASGAGAEAMQELIDTTRHALEGKKVTPKKFLQQIAFNLFPHIDVFLENGYTKEEMKMVHETRKIMRAPNIQVTATCVRVPVLRAHSEAINLTTTRKISAARAREILSKAPGVKVLDNPAKNEYPMPILASGGYDTWVGRIREDISQKNGIDLFCSADQLLKGAAFNAVQIAELL